MTGRLNYASGLMVGRNPYGLKIKPADFSKRLGTSKQFPEWQYCEGGDVKYPVKTRADVTEQLRTPWNSHVEYHLPKEQVSTRTRQSSAPEEEERSDRGIQDL